MKTVHNAIAAALLSGAVGLVLPAGAATTTNSPARSGTDYGAAATDTGTAAAKHDASTATETTDAKNGAIETGSKPVIKSSTAIYTKPQGGSEKAEMMKTADLNRQSLSSIQSGATFTPTVATNDTRATPTNSPRKNTLTKKRPSNTPAKAKTTL